MRLRYAGQAPVTFTVLGLDLAPDDEFEVDDEAAAVLLRRSDVEEVPPASARRGKAAKSATPEDVAGVPAPVTEEVDHGVSERR